MSGPYRLAAGGRIDRSRRLGFRFDGQEYAGHPGDTLASALLANGVRVVGRSFKYHRPRGVVTAGPEEPAALVELRDGARREPNVPATTVELFDGLEAASQNRWPSLRRDFGAISGMLAPLLPAGFYYKTFMWPRSFWERLYEPAIRKAAGLGRAATEADPDRYETVHAHCDLLVVGSGAAGLEAALAAAKAGKRVTVLEQDFEAGGATLLDLEQGEWRRAVLGELAQWPEVRVLTRTAAFGLYDHNVVGAVERVSDHVAEPPAGAARQRQWVIRAGEIVLATGAQERLIAFPGNDRPGVMLASAVLTYLQRFGVAAGQRAVVFLNNDEAYGTAFALAGRGIDIAAVVDVREDSAAGRRARRGGLPVRFGAEVCATHGRLGDPAVAAVGIRRIGESRAERVAADLVCVSGGFTPQVQLAAQARLPLVWDPARAAFAARGGDTIHVAGAAAAEIAGERASGRADGAADPVPAGAVSADATLSDVTPAEAGTPDPTPLLPFWEVKAPGKAFVDLQHDVTAADIRLAHREGYAHVEHAKRYTTHGMATDQGKIGGLVGSAILAEARGEPVEAVGLPTARPYVSPVAWGALAGAEVGGHFRPKRRLPLHDWHAQSGAVFVRLGLWLRPLVYSASGDTSWEPVLAEARNVRTAVGLTDVSSLGKIDVQGPDAATFLDRIYANTFSTLAVGRARYGLMLREDGIVFDDGTTSRLAADHFFVTTTTANAAAVQEHLEFHLHTAWPELDVQITSVADQWAQFAVAGPKARSVLAQVVDRDLCDAAFPFMAAGAARIADVPGRLFRISFSGELAYEVSVPARHALTVWEAILAAGEPFGIRPYGLDALNLLRIEKGHVAGSELNGQTTARDLGLERMLKKAGDHVGRVLAQRPGLVDADRLALVGVRTRESTARLRAGAHLVARPGARDSLGFVTAACPPTEGAGFIGLALLARGRERIGETLHAADPVRGGACDVEIVSPHFVDPENVRVRDASPVAGIGPPPQIAVPPAHDEHVCGEDPPTVPADGEEAARGDGQAGPPAAEQGAEEAATLQADEPAPDAAPPGEPEPARPAATAQAAAAPARGIRIARLQRDIVEVMRRGAEDTALRRAFAAEFGLELPAAGRAAAAGPLTALAVAPGTWLVMEAAGAPASLAASLEHAAAGAASIVDQSSACEAIELCGDEALWVLSKGCRLDLHPRAFGQQFVARTIIAQVPVLVYRVEDARFILLVPATLARSFLEFLVHAAADVGCAVA